ncbi:sensor histidine kinase [Cryptosporangium arvum]|uniref:sensor histidine kinase n=1 Tax=Cryptosporangium arvum TaxID=80871 RepID=UPI00068717FA|nr:histidine kinase [Cryptosporangium arvum]
MMVPRPLTDAASLLVAPVLVVRRASSWPRAAVAFPLSVLTSALTALWCFVGVAAATCALRYDASPAPLAPMTLRLGDGVNQASLTLGLQARTDRMVFGTVVGVVLLLTLPFAARAALVLLGRLLTPRVSPLRRLERDLHDGPQQRLVRLALDLGRAEHRFDADPAGARVVLADAITQTREALDELRALARGVAPPVLVERGLRAALAALVRRSPVPVTLSVDVPDELPAEVETTLYFVVAEALANVAKHSGATHCRVEVRRRRVTVTDDGIGGAAIRPGHGLAGLGQRLGGRLALTSPVGGPTTLVARIPR